MTDAPPPIQDAAPSRDVAPAAVSLIALFAFDALILLPMVVMGALVMLASALGSLALLVGGVVVLVAGPFTDMPGGPAAAMLAGVAFIAGAICVLALLILACLALAGLTVRFAQLHLRLLKAVS